MNILLWTLRSALSPELTFTFQPQVLHTRTKRHKVSNQILLGFNTAALEVSPLIVVYGRG